MIDWQTLKEGTHLEINKLEVYNGYPLTIGFEDVYFKEIDGDRVTFSWSSPEEEELLVDTAGFSLKLENYGYTWIAEIVEND